VEDWHWKKGLVLDAEADGTDRYQPEGGHRQEQDDGLGDQGGGRERKKGNTWQQLKTL
jgi:hypothetical protein